MFCLVFSKPGCQRHHALEFWMILDSGNTCNYRRIKMTLMGFCLRFCKTSTDLVLTSFDGSMVSFVGSMIICSFFLVDASHNISAAPRQLMNLHYLRAKCLNLLSWICVV